MIPTMSSEAVARSRTPVLDFVPFAAFALAVMVAVLGQAAWLDGKIEILQEGQAAIRERLAGLETSVDGLKNRVAGLENLVAGLENRVAGLENLVAGLESRVAGLENRVAGLETSIGAISRHPSEPAS